MSGDEPLGAALLVGLAGLLVFLEGVLIGLASEVVSAFGAGDAGILLGGIAVIALFLGSILALVGLLLYRWPDSHRGLGAAAIVLSLASLLVGGGFYVGTFLGVLGGILGIVWEDPSDDGELPEWGSSWGSEVTTTSPSSPGEAAASWARCSNCGASLAPKAAACPKCETPVRAPVVAPAPMSARPAPPR